MKLGPSAEAGKSFTAAAPARQAARTSVGVAAPGSTGMPRSAAQATSSVSVWGITRNVAPASTAVCAASIDSTVPAPIASPRRPPMSGPATAAMARKAMARRAR